MSDENFLNLLEFCRSLFHIKLVIEDALFNLLDDYVESEKRKYLDG